MKRMNLIDWKYCGFVDAKTAGEIIEKRMRENCTEVRKQILVKRFQPQCFTELEGESLDLYEEWVESAKDSAKSM